MLPGLKITLEAVLDSDDSVAFVLKWPGARNLPEMPALGLSFQMDARLQNVRYFGLGPDDNYVDRCEGAVLGWHDYKVAEGMTRYAKPQESGNRMGVRQLELTGADGHGVCITGKGLEISVQPYLPEELACVYHYDELQGSCRTILDIAAFRMGVGGDVSWGAPVLPQYTYSADKPYELRFRMSAI